MDERKKAFKDRMQKLNLPKWKDKDLENFIQKYDIIKKKYRKDVKLTVEGVDEASPTFMGSKLKTTYKNFKQIQSMNAQQLGKLVEILETIPFQEENPMKNFTTIVLAHGYNEDIEKEEIMKKVRTDLEIIKSSLQSKSDSELMEMIQTVLDKEYADSMVVKSESEKANLESEKTDSESEEADSESEEDDFNQDPPGNTVAEQKPVKVENTFDSVITENKDQMNGSVIRENKDQMNDILSSKKTLSVEHEMLLKSRKYYKMIRRNLYLIRAKEFNDVKHSLYDRLTKKGYHMNEHLIGDKNQLNEFILNDVKKAQEILESMPPKHEELEQLEKIKSELMEVETDNGSAKTIRSTRKGPIPHHLKQCLNVVT